MNVNLCPLSVPHVQCDPQIIADIDTRLLSFFPNATNDSSGPQAIAIGPVVIFFITLSLRTIYVWCNVSLYIKNGLWMNFLAMSFRAVYACLLAFFGALSCDALFAGGDRQQSAIRNLWCSKDNDIIILVNSHGHSPETKTVSICCFNFQSSLFAHRNLWNHQNLLQILPQTFSAGLNPWDN